MLFIPLRLFCAFPAPSLSLSGGGSNRLWLLLSEQCASVEVCADLPGNADCKCSPQGLFCLLISDEHFWTAHARWLLRGIRLDVQTSAFLNITTLHPALICTLRQCDAQVSPIPTNMCYSPKQTLSISVCTKINLQWCNFPHNCHNLSLLMDMYTKLGKQLLHLLEHHRLC